MTDVCRWCGVRIESTEPEPGEVIWWLAGTCATHCPVSDNTCHAPAPDLPGDLRDLEQVVAWLDA